MSVYNILSIVSEEFYAGLHPSVSLNSYKYFAMCKITLSNGLSFNGKYLLPVPVNDKKDSLVQTKINSKKDKGEHYLTQELTHDEKMDFMKQKAKESAISQYLAWAKLNNMPLELFDAKVQKRLNM